jgi:LysR family transcriptional regulator, regulator of gene expression of beta-lactamase
MHLPLNALRAFEASARHLSFTRAAIELNVSQAAVSQQVKNLEERLGAALFRRVPRGLALTDEGVALLPTVADAFERLSRGLQRFHNGRAREVLTLGCVSSLLVRWLMPRLPQFQREHPWIDLRIFGNNNRVDLAGEGLDVALRFGQGAWHGVHAVPLFEAPLSPLCAPALAVRLQEPQHLLRETLLRSYRTDEWPAWFERCGLQAPVLGGPVLDSSLALAEAALQGAGVALLPLAFFERELQQGVLLRPFQTSIVTGRYWLTRLQSRQEGPAMLAFADWLHQQCAQAAA